MRVLIACEESQTVCKAFRDRGHEAYSCDILPCSGGHPEWHILGNALNYFSGPYDNVYIETQDAKPHLIQKWDLIIAHPPCTYLCNSGVRWFNDPRHPDRWTNLR